MSPRRARRQSGGASEAARKRHAWLELVQLSGPFLTLPVVDRVFPDGLPEVPLTARASVRGAVADVLAAHGAGREALVEQVLRDVLDWADHVRVGHDVPAALAEPVPGYGISVSPDFAFFTDKGAQDDADVTVLGDVDDEDVSEGDDDGDDAAEESHSVAADGPWRMLGIVTPWDVHPLQRTTQDGWTASGVERLAHLLRARDVPVGLATDGRWWALVWAPVGATTGAAVWDASLWSEEPESFRAFVALLTRARFLSVAASDTLPRMLEQSQEAQEDVTVTLGRQVRDAVELLLDTLDRLDAESGGVLLDGVDDDELYDGVVTVMMRLVFLLFAEERRLLPSDDAVYAAGYGIARLVEKLEGQAALAGETSLEHRTGAWHRLLAVSRALHHGVAHEDLRLPAYGGGLFDPDRYPWLEGRRGLSADGVAVDVAARPPAVDDRTVLRMLQAVQYVVIGSERRRLTFRALDVEQIGYVYEGLLELEVRTATEVVLGLVRPAAWPKRAEQDPAELPLSQADAWLAEVPPRLAQRLKKPTGRSDSWLEKNLAADLDAYQRTALMRALGGSGSRAERVLPFAGVLRWTAGVPAVTLPGRRYVAPSSRRAATGTHYTPRSLAEDIVVNTLEPLVYRPGPLETADRTTWRIRPSSEILDLRVADIAMGSGAFLVAACRYLADRLVEAWVAEGRSTAGPADPGRPVADAEVEQVGLQARRLVAEHCLYGVDINPLAVDMAKLSLWLVTMDRERPFGFLDDRFACGDSLLGLASIDQLETLHIDPAAGRRLNAGTLDIASGWRSTLAQAADVRRRITAAPVITARDVEHKQRLLAEARALAAPLQVVADAVTATGFTAARLNAKRTQSAFIGAALQVSAAIPDDPEKLYALVDTLQADRPKGTAPRRPLHWPLIFPEVFSDARDPGFDVVIGNPPFVGGQDISGKMGSQYLAWLQRWDGGGVKGSADLAARFVLRTEKLLSARGQLGYIATNTLLQGGTLAVGLKQVTDRGFTIRRGRSSHPWPSASAKLEVVNVWASRALVSVEAPRWLDGEEVPRIGADLQPVGRVGGPRFALKENEGIAYQGSILVGLGFVVPSEQAALWIASDHNNADVLTPYLIGKDLNQRSDYSPSRWVINFRDWPFERVAKYAELLDILRRLVKPKRDLVKRESSRVNWWRFGEHRPGLYAAIAGMDHVLALSLHGDAALPLRVPNQATFSHGCAVFATGDFGDFALLSSSLHQIWTLRYTGTIGHTLRYAPSDIFLTFPRILPSSGLTALGVRLDRERRELMLSRGWGLTATYKHIHDPVDRDPEVQALRDLHTEIDYAALDAYGWSDLDPQIGHHPTKIGTRWTVSKDARFELLDRLLEENQRRYAAEQNS